MASQLNELGAVPAVDFSSDTNEQPEGTLVLENVLNAAQVEFDTEIFIEEIRQLPCLWNTSLAAYKDRNIKTNAWHKLSVMFSKDVEFLKTQFKYLKDNLKRCLERQARATKSGAGSSKVPMCKYYSELAFLCDKIANKLTKCNMNIITDLDERVDMQPSSSKPPQVAVTLIGTKRNFQGIFNDTSPINTKCRKSATEARAEIGYTVDTMLVQTLKDMEKPNLSAEVSDAADADTLFCKSLIPALKELPARKNRQAKLRIQQVMYDLEFGESD